MVNYCIQISVPEPIVRYLLTFFAASYNTETPWYCITDRLPNQKPTHSHWQWFDKIRCNYWLILLYRNCFSIRLLSTYSILTPYTNDGPNVSQYQVFIIFTIKNEWEYQIGHQNALNQLEFQSLVQHNNTNCTTANAIFMDNFPNTAQPTVQPTIRIVIDWKLTLHINRSWK